MASDNSINQPQTIFAGATSGNDFSNNGGNSRLLVNSANLRNVLESRNLYTPDVEYPLNPNSVQKVINAISSIGSALAPFSGFDLKNSAIGNVASLIGNSTPLSEIGLVMLGKQFAMNFSSHIAQQTLPQIDLGGFLKGGQLFRKNVDYKITKVPQSGFQNFLDDLIFNNPTNKNPFTKNPTNDDYINNTGTGQLGKLYDAINQNIYKESKLDSSTLYSAASGAGAKILPRGIVLGGNDKQVGTGQDDKRFFNFDNKYFNAYLSHDFVKSSISITNANISMISAYINEEGDSPEYAPNQDFIDNNFGTTEKTVDTNNVWNDNAQNPWVNNNKEFGNDNIGNKLIWGRDGITNDANNNINDLRGTSNHADEQVNPSGSINAQYNIRAGLLEYTRNLLNATNGKIVDITRKAFTKNGKVDGFNGSALWKANSSTYASDPNNNIAGVTGVRQHSSLDQYDRFAKAIRFDGNQVYGGNKDSVIYKSVIPRIHPTLEKDGTINPKNLMFSIENLAVRVLSKDTYGIIDDEYGSPIPACEVGPFNGRIMWFPPYNLEIQETSSAKFEPTMIIGRNEPMYNYISSERGATLSFTLLVDYPQQLKNYANTTGKQREIAEFFAFGGDPFVDKFVSIENYEFKIAKLQSDIETIKGKTKPAEPNDLPETKITIVFPNDVPSVNDNLNTIIDDLYTKYTYEIYDGLPSSDITSWGLNIDSYFKTGITQSAIVNGNQTYKLTGGSSQYTSVGLTDQFGNNVLNNALFNIFNDENNRIVYSVYIHGAASKLFLGAGGAQYNYLLGERRAQAVQNLVKAKLVAMFGESIADNIEVTWDTVLGESVGDVQASDATATKAAIPYKETKQARYAEIDIHKNGRTLPPVKADLSPTDTTNISKLQSQIEATKTQIRQIKTSLSCVLNERGTTTANGTTDTGILHGFDSISGNYYYPVFHSQTPEDMHKRLTFLHQCQRQGASKRWNSPDPANATGPASISAKNSVFGRQPICILRVGDFFYTKVIIENYTIDYSDTTWDMNPEGFGMQPMLAKVTLQLKLIGGQSLKGPIDALQNAVTFNYYANSSYTNAGMYKLPSKQADKQESFIREILTAEQAQMKTIDDERTVKAIINSVIQNNLMG
jgi:hypothetical protein